MNQMLTVALTSIGTMIIASIYSLAAVSLRKRVTVRSPEARAIEEIVPAVNALMETNGPMMHGIIAILEAQKGQCNGNVDSALEVNRSAKKKFDEFLITSAKVGK